MCKFFCVLLLTCGCGVVSTVDSYIPRHQHAFEPEVLVADPPLVVTVEYRPDAGPVLGK